MACDNSGSIVGLKSGVRGAACCLLVIRNPARQRAGSTGWRRLTLGRPCPQAGWLPGEAEAVDALPTPDPDAKGAIYSLGRSERLEKFHSHVLPLSGEKA